MKHKHSEIIKAFVDGVECQNFNFSKQWVNIKELATFDFATDVRIKPEPKPDVIKYLNRLNFFTTSALWEESDYHITKDCLKLTFDGETGELKDAKVIKNV